MDAVVDFLLEYYVWILVVLVILLITVIGFLADTKRKKKKRESINSEQNMVNQNSNGIEPNMNNGMNTYDNNMMNNFNNNMNGYEQIQNVNNFEPTLNMLMNNFNNMDNMSYNMNNSMNNDVNNMMNSNVNNFSNDMQNTNINNNLNNDTFFSSTSQQTPTFASRNVEIPRQVETTPIMNFGSTPSAVIEPVPVIEPNMSQNINFINGQANGLMNNINNGVTPIVDNTNSTEMMNANINNISNMSSNMMGIPNIIASNVVETPNVVPTPVEAPNVNLVIPQVNEVPSMVREVTPNVNLEQNTNMVGAPITNQTLNNVNTPIENNALNRFESVSPMMATNDINTFQNPTVNQPQMTSNINMTPGIVNSVPNQNDNVITGTNQTVGTYDYNNQMPTASDNWQL